MADEAKRESARFIIVVPLRATLHQAAFVLARPILDEHEQLVVLNLLTHEDASKTQH